MQLSLNCVGTLKNGPERDLVFRYLERAVAAGKAVGVSAIEIREIQESRAKYANERKFEEAKRLRSLVHLGSEKICFDERGKSLTSTSFSDIIAKARDRSIERLAFFIGGPDGLDTPMLAESFLNISFGAMTWPHQLVRIMAVEQIYRSITIMNGHPYHRE